jgi:hypothetical protein
MHFASIWTQYLHQLATMVQCSVMAPGKLSSSPTIFQTNKGFYTMTHISFKTQVDAAFTLLAEFKGTSKTGEGVSLTIIDNEGFNLDTVRTTGIKACGDCTHARPTGGRKNGLCYVYTRPGGSQGALGGILKAFEVAEVLELEVFIERFLLLAEAANYARFGKYGDPAASPTTAKIIARLALELRVLDVPYTGYTHQWRKKKAEPLKGLLMASTETTEQTIQAQLEGWYIFEVKPRKAKLDVIWCPAQKAKAEKAAPVTCKDCRMCDGSTVPHIQVRVH